MSSGGLFEEVRYWDESLSALFEDIYMFWTLAFVTSKHLNCSLSFGFFLLWFLFGFGVFFC